MTPRGRGYLPNARAHRMALPRHVAAGELPLEARELVPIAAVHAPAWDQLQTGACTGHGSSDGLTIAFAASGQLLPFRPSPIEIYRNARGVDRAFHNGVPVPLDDSGAQPSTVMSTINAFGICAVRSSDGMSSDADPATINAEPLIGDLEVEYIVRPVREVSIVSVAEGAQLADVVQGVKTAIAQRHPVGIACNADGPFQTWSGGPAYSPPVGVAAPDHWVSLIAYRMGAHGAEFLLKNSWGAQWGAVVQQDGFALFGCMWVTEAFLATCWDLTVYLPLLEP